MPEVLEPSAFCSEHARKGSKQTETVTVVDVKVAKARPGWLLLCCVGTEVRLSSARLS